MQKVNNILNIDNKKKTEQEILAEKAREILKSGGEQALNDFISSQMKERQELQKTNAVRTEEPRGDNPVIFHDSPTPLPILDIIASPSSGTLAENVEKAIDKAPVDRSVQPVSKPRNSQEAIMMLYPKSAAFGRYNFSELGENILSTISRKLQGYMSRSYASLKPDVLGEISIRIDTSELVGDDKKTFIDEVGKMMTYKFTFWWQKDKVPQGTKNVETTGVIISAMHNYIGTSYVDIIVNKWALPFMLYYGPGVGANLVNTKTSLLLPGKYTKRLHRILSGYVDAGQFDYQIQKMRSDFELPPSYTNATIKRSIIEPSIKHINDMEDRFSVGYEFICKEPEKVRSKKEKDTIRFTISSKVGEFEYVAENDQRDYILKILPAYLSEPYASSVWKYVQTWRNHGDLGFVYAKTKYYTDQANAGKMSPQKARNFLVKAVEEETKVKLHLSRKKSIKDDDE